MAVSRYPFSDFRSFSRLFAAYTAEFAPVSSHFSGDFRDPRQRGQIALQVADHYPFRSELRFILEEQNRAFGAGPETLKNIERLSQPDAVAIVTGQQLGLFTGPLYTIYKTITTVQLARRMEHDTGRPVVPIFWLEGEDHDIEEVRSAAVYSGNELRRITYRGSEASSGPVGRIVFDDTIEETVSELEDALLPTDFREDLMRLVREHYRPGATFMQAFVGMMSAFFATAGLVFVSSDDARMKRLAAPVFKRELREFEKSNALLRRAGGKLSDIYHVQVETEPTNIFLLIDGARRSLQVSNGRFQLKGKDQTFSRDELFAMLEEQPEAFSPNVVLRPVLQDALLPTAAYVAGPGEIAYFAQLKAIYEWAGVPMPIIYPRASVTLVESRIAKVMERYRTSLPVFEEQVDRLFHTLIVDAMEVDAEGIFERAGRHLNDAVNAVVPAVESVDQSLVKSAEATRAALMKEWDRLKDRVIKAEKRRHDQMKEQVEKAAANLFPGGALQERSVSPLYFINKYGLGLIERLLDEIELDTTTHQVVSF